jgi:hypothetical protein
MKMQSWLSYGRFDYFLLLFTSKSMYFVSRGKSLEGFSAVE